MVASRHSSWSPYRQYMTASAGLAEYAHGQPGSVKCVTEIAIPSWLHRQRAALGSAAKRRGLARPAAAAKRRVGPAGSGGEAAGVAPPAAAAKRRGGAGIS